MHTERPRARSNATLGRFGTRDLGEPEWVDQNLPKEPEDATKSTEEQRRLQEQLDHQDDDPDAPGLHQSHRDVPDESTR